MIILFHIEELMHLCKTMTLINGTIVFSVQSSITPYTAQYLITSMTLGESGLSAT